MRVIELDCRYSSMSEAEDSKVGVEVEAELGSDRAVVDVSGECSSVFLRLFFSFLDGWSSEASSRFLRFFFRSVSSEAGIRIR